MVEEPRVDKSFMISFDAKDKNQNKAYNRAIEKICLEHKLNPFHQSGSHDSVGYQAWEIFTETNREVLLNLIPEIQARAEEIHNERRKLGLLETDTW